MNTKQNIIENVYNENIDYILKNVPKKYASDAKIGYKEYLTKKYENRILDHIIKEVDVPIISDVLSEQEQTEFKYMTKEDLISSVILDKAMNEIEYLHTIAFSYAELKKNGETVAQLNQAIANDMTFRLENLKDKVLKFNQERANSVVRDTYCYMDFALEKKNTQRI